MERFMRSDFTWLASFASISSSRIVATFAGMRLVVPALWRVQLQVNSANFKRKRLCNCAARVSCAKSSRKAARNCR
jgi:hypothetical protein